MAFRDDGAFDLRCLKGHTPDWTYKLVHDNPLYDQVFFNKSGDCPAAFLSGSAAVSADGNCMMYMDPAGASQCGSPGPP